MLGDLSGKKVLEFGCSVGTITRKLAQKVLPGGKVFAFDIIERNITVAASHMKKYKHVSFYHHGNLNHFNTTVKLPKIDALISTGTLSYLQKPQAVLKHLGKKVKKGGRVVFLDYDQFFFLIPNVPWISDEIKVTRIFKQAGFSIKVTKRRGLLWRYIFIHGEKI